MATLEMSMAEEKKTMSMRLHLEAIEAAKLAAAYKRMTVIDYASSVLLEAANRDIEDGHRQRVSWAASPPEVRAKRKPKGGETHGSEK